MEAIRAPRINSNPLYQPHSWLFELTRRHSWGWYSGFELILGVRILPPSLMGSRYSSVKGTRTRTGLIFSGSGPYRAGYGPDIGPGPLKVRILRCFSTKTLKKQGLRYKTVLNCVKTFLQTTADICCQYQKLHPAMERLCEYLIHEVKQEESLFYSIV